MPQVLGYQRSRWSAERLSLVLKKHAGIKVHSSTLRRGLSRLGIVRHRAAPTLRSKDPHKEDKLAVINDALSHCSADHLVFYEDEVDIHLNPKIVADWGLRGKQKQVLTPDQNKKYYLAGALHAGTGKVTSVGDYLKNSELFIAMLECLRRRIARPKPSLWWWITTSSIRAGKPRWLKQNPRFGLLSSLFTAPGSIKSRGYGMRCMRPFPGNNHELAEV